MGANETTPREDSNNGQRIEFSESRKSFDSLFVSTPTVSAQSLLTVADSGNNSSKDSARK
jgi:hypothetical protein